MSQDRDTSDIKEWHMDALEEELFEVERTMINRFMSKDFNVESADDLIRYHGELSEEIGKRYENQTKITA